MDRIKMEEVLKSIPHDDLIEFLVQEFSFDENIVNRFKNSFTAYFPKETKEEFIDRLWRSLDLISDRYGYIDYNHSSDYSHTMYGFINESENLLKIKEYDSALNIILSILDSIPDTEIDDSDGSTGEVADSCFEVLADILAYSLINDNNISERILDYILNEIATGDLANYGIEIYDLLNYFIDDKKYLEQIKDALEDAVTKLEQKGSTWRIDKYNKLIKEINI